MSNDLKYFEWMVGLVGQGIYSTRKPALQLLRYLHTIEFTYILEMDRNRAEDGKDLRYRFSYDTGIKYVDNRPCSVLEMMVALAMRCEEHIMDDPDIGNRLGQWFWSMMDNLGLYNTNFNQKHIDNVITRFLNREYGPNGKGGLFTVKKSAHDLSKVEIWNQMCWYLDELIK